MSFLEKKTIILLTSNEYLGLKKQLQRILKLNRKIFNEVILIDYKSNDQSLKFCKQFKIKIIKQKKKGLIEAYKLANMHSTNNKIIVFFPKGTYEVEIIMQIANYLDEGYDLVIPSRQLKKSIHEDDDKLFRIRKWGVRFLANIIYFIWGKKKKNRVYDVLHGVKGWNKNFFNKIKLSKSGNTIDLEMVVEAYKKNVNIKEFPIIEKKRFYGDTHFNIFPIAKEIIFYFIRKI